LEEKLKQPFERNLSSELPILGVHA
jgi:hypothetical protein